MIIIIRTALDSEKNTASGHKIQILGFSNLKWASRAHTYHRLSDAVGLRTTLAEPLFYKCTKGKCGLGKFGSRFLKDTRLQPKRTSESRNV